MINYQGKKGMDKYEFIYNRQAAEREHNLKKKEISKLLKQFHQYKKDGKYNKANQLIKRISELQERVTEIECFYPELMLRY